MTVNPDPVQLEILRNAFTAAAEEMSVAVRRTARSTTVREMLDYSTAIFHGDGRNIAQSALSPMALTLAPCLMEVLDHHLPADDWRVGDVVITNDPYCGSQHLPDIVTFRPVFVDGRRLGFTGTMAHHVDLGGGSPGSYDMTAKEIYAEGVRIPPLRLYREGRLNEEVLALLLQNVRQPAVLRGDLMSQIAALDIGERGLRRIAGKYGVPALTASAERMLDQAEAAMRRAIEALPDGVHEFSDCLDDDGVGDTPVHLRLTLTIAGDGMRFDFSNSDPQVPAPINCTFNVLRSTIHYAVIAALGRDIPVNSGCFQPIDVVARPGTCVAAIAPAPVVNRIQMAHRIVNVVMGALAKALPDRIPAAYYGVSYVYMLEAVEGDGGRSIYFDSEVGGWGAEPARDGANAFSCGVHNIAAVPIEMLESRHPITFTTYALRPNSGGAGRTRGGLGLVREFMLDAPTGTFAATFDRFRVPPYGLAGGQPGMTGSLTLLRQGDARALRSKVSGLRLQAGDRIRIETAGGGGFGPPGERPAQARAADIAAGYLSDD
ncbi:MAG: hydantoinase B/oxoprolinase family protein [Alphaproteobacteria bacterium]|nr:hydantoinase B/oxoprolinase family protein [Alphaproteobacteria bacterium]